jgi:putative hydrolase of the HAD superfamily
MDTKGYIFDFGGTLDTAGVHWGKAVWHAYERHGVNVGEAAFRDAYVQVERRLGREDIIRPDFTFFQTLDVKLSLQFDYLKEKKYLCTRNAEISPRALVEDLYQRVAANVRHSADVLAELGKKATLALVSNFYGNLETVLHEFALAPLFQSVVHCVELLNTGLARQRPIRDDHRFAHQRASRDHFTCFVFDFDVGQLLSRHGQRCNECNCQA